MKSAARAVVIGGGVGGCAILYWLTRLGWDDVVLCERAELTSGSTFHSAGLVGQRRDPLGREERDAAERMAAFRPVDDRPVGGGLAVQLAAVEPHAPRADDGIDAGNGSALLHPVPRVP